MTDVRITLGGHVLPKNKETQHILVCGTTGTGKSTLIEEVVESARSRGDRLVICDPAGSYVSQFAHTGDYLLNPFDARSPGWSLFNEMRNDYDADRLARAIVPSGKGESVAWHHYARVLLSAVLRVLVRRGDTNTEALIKACTTAPVAELGPDIAGSPAAGLFDPDASRALASTRFVLSTYLAPHAYLRPGMFSLRRWVRDGSGALFLTWRTDMQTVLAPLISTWISVCVGEVLTLEPDPERRIWLMVDELAALGQVEALPDALTLGRKFGLCIAAGLQSTAQLDALYGSDQAVTLRACFRTLAALGISRSDPNTAEFLSRAIGERELIRDEQTRSLGDTGYSRSVTARRVSERVVLASEIAGLPDLEGFLAVAGSASIERLRLEPVERLRLVEAFVERPL